MSPPGAYYYDKSNINELELWPIVEGLRCWYPEFKGKSVTIFTNNTQVMYMLRKGTSTNSTCMEWLRETKNFNIRLVAKYVNTKRLEKHRSASPPSKLGIQSANGDVNGCETFKLKVYGCNSAQACKYVAFLSKSMRYYL